MPDYGKIRKERKADIEQGSLVSAFFLGTKDDLINNLKNDRTKYSVVALSTCSTKQVDDRTVVLAMYQR